VDRESWLGRDVHDEWKRESGRPSPGESGPPRRRMGSWAAATLVIAGLLTAVVLVGAVVLSGRAAERDPAAAAAAAERAERSRVADILWEAHDLSNRAWDSFWTGRNEAYYEEMYPVVHNQVLPDHDIAITLLDGAVTTDQVGATALDATRACLRASRDRYLIAFASLNGESSPDAESVAWDRSTQLCDESIRLASELGA
jgi:hypothetical protein